MKYLLLVLLLVSTHVAAGLTCDARYAPYVTGALSCELGSVNNDFVGQILQVNIDSMFDTTNWQLLERSEDYSSDIIGDLTLNSFNIDWTNLTSVMFVQKDGAGDPSTYVGWLLDRTAASYNYQSPFLTATGEVKDISHLSWYATTSDDGTPFNSVPTPGTIALLGVGLIILRKRLT